MPELPEVENVRRSVEVALSTCRTIRAVEVFRPDLRYPFPKNLAVQLIGRDVLSVRRRAKYLLFDLGEWVFLSHLGMSGSWRLTEKFEKKKHDHLRIQFTDGNELIFHDPRRFGFVDLFRKSEEPKNLFLQHLGVEPLSKDFNAKTIHAAANSRKIPVKNFLMDQKNVVGVGNIYAAEALFLAGVRPTRPSCRVTLKEWETLVTHIKKTLLKSIQKGGTTLRDYVSADGAEGQFQNELFVYGREGEDCRRCGSRIHNSRLSGRSSFWCRKCQK